MRAHYLAYSRTQTVFVAQKNSLPSKYVFHLKIGVTCQARRKGGYDRYASIPVPQKLPRSTFLSRQKNQFWSSTVRVTSTFLRFAFGGLACFHFTLPSKRTKCSFSKFLGGACLRTPLGVRALAFVWSFFSLNRTLPQNQLSTGLHVPRILRLQQA